MITSLVERRGRIPQWTFAERIRKVRRDLHMTQEQFSTQLGVGLKRYSAWEAGKNMPVDVGTIAVRLEEESGVPRTWFMGWEDHNAPDPGDASKLPRLDSDQEPSD